MLSVRELTQRKTLMVFRTNYQKTLVLLKAKHGIHVWIVCATFDDLIIDPTLLKTILDKNLYGSYGACDSHSPCI